MYKYYLMAFVMLVSIEATQAMDTSNFLPPCRRVIPDKITNVKVIPSKPTYNLDLSTADITKLSEEWGADPAKIGYSAKYHSYGYTQTTMHTNVETDSQGLFLIPNRAPINESEIPKLMCFKSGSVVTLSFDKFVVYISRDYKQKKCVFDLIMQHENMHSDLNNENLKKLGDEVKIYAEKRTLDKIFFLENSKIFNYDKILTEDIKNFASRRWGEMLSTHKYIDENYTKLQKY